MRNSASIRVCLRQTNKAMLALLAGDDIIECDFVGYAYGARHVQRRSRRMSSMDF
jgi:hypothetical protein